MSACYGLLRHGLCSTVETPYHENLPIAASSTSNHSTGTHCPILDAKSRDPRTMPTTPHNPTTVLDSETDGSNAATLPATTVRSTPATLPVTIARATPATLALTKDGDA